MIEKQQTNIEQEIISKEVLDEKMSISKKIDILLNPKTIIENTEVEWKTIYLNSVKILKNILKTKKNKQFNLKIELENLNKELSAKEVEIINKKLEINDVKTNSFREKSVSIFIKNIFFKDKNIKKLNKEIFGIRTEIDNIENTILSLENDIVKSDYDLLKSKKELKAKIKDYYEKISQIKLTKEEKQEFLTPEFLSNISTWEYMQLWKKLNPYFVSHVTRQGYRDHVWMSGHTGWFNEFANWFKDMLEDEKSLKPPIHIWENWLKSRDEEWVKNYLKDILKISNTKEEAYDNLYDQLHFTLASAPKYPDKTAIHFAWETVLNDLYWWENNNEIFLIYPSDFIASQYSFSFNWWQKDFTKPQSDATWNDIFVWPNTLENPSIWVDAWIVFLPENTLVDKNTGSKYIKDENWNLIQVWEENSITSKEYWEKYFANNLDKKPAHIVYYNWEPNEAINNFLYEFDEKNPDKICLIKTENTDENNKLLWFDENHIKDIYNDSKSNMWYDELVNIWVKIINDFYEQKN